MICTVTFNPSLDYIVRVDDMRLGVINRTTCEQILPGGKGINVSIVLGNLGHKSRALGFLAGFTGDEIARRVAQAGVDADFIRVEKGMSRINAKIKSAEETELNGMGPEVTAADVDALLAKLDVLAAGDTLVVSGSVPACLPSDMYEQIMARLAGRGVRIVVDAERDLLRRVLPYQPFLVKPNNIELGDIYGAALETRADVVPYARLMQQEGARNVLVSMAGGGRRARGRGWLRLREPGRARHRGQLRGRGRLVCRRLPGGPGRDGLVRDGLPYGPLRGVGLGVQRPPCHPRRGRAAHGPVGRGVPKASRALSCARRTGVYAAPHGARCTQIGLVHSA